MRPVAQQVAQQHVGQDAAVDVRTAHRQRHALAAEHVPVGQNARQRGRAGPFRDLFRALRQQRDRFFHHAFGHAQHVIHVAVDELEALPPHAHHRDALGDGGATPRHGLGAGKAVQAVMALDLHADDGGLGCERRTHRGAAADQAAAADRHHQHVERPRILDQLEGQRALARHDGGVVERMDEDAAFGLRHCQRVRHGVGQRLAVQHHGRTP